MVASGQAGRPPLEQGPRHNLLHLGEKFLTLDALYGCGLLVVPESELLSTHEPSPYL